MIASLPAWLQWLLAGLIIGLVALQLYRTIRPAVAGVSKSRAFILFGCRNRGAPSEHGSEVLLLGAIAVGMIGILWRSVELRQVDGLDMAAFLLILQRVVEAVTARWSARSLDRATTALANSPPAQPPATSPDQPPAPAPAAPAPAPEE